MVLMKYLDKQMVFKDSGGPMDLLYHLDMQISFKISFDSENLF